MRNDPGARPTRVVSAYLSCSFCCLGLLLLLLPLLSFLLSLMLRLLLSFSISAPPTTISKASVSTWTALQDYRNEKW